MKTVIIIWIGGGIGSVLRYLVQVGASRLMTVVYPAGTFMVNIAGCFLIGLLYGMAERQSWLTLEWRLFLVTGLCGGFTTFSGFSFEGISLFRQGNYLYFILYIFLSVIAGLMATLGGMVLVAKRVHSLI